MKSAKLDCQEQREETVCKVEWEILDINRIEIPIGGSADYTWLKMKAPGPLEAHTYRYWPALVLMNLAPTPSPVHIIQIIYTSRPLAGASRLNARLGASNSSKIFFESPT
jgi:hypothetical protein